MIAKISRATRSFLIDAMADSWTSFEAYIDWDNTVSLQALSDDDLACVLDAVDGKVPKGVSSFKNKVLLYAGIKSGSAGFGNKPRSLEDVVELLKYYIASLPDRRLYCSTEIDEGVSVCLGYFVQSIKHEPGASRDDPPRIRMSMRYKTANGVETYGASFSWADCRGKTAPQILAENGYLVQSPVLDSEHDMHKSDFISWHENVGLAMDAGGYAAAAKWDYSGSKILPPGSRVVNDPNEEAESKRRRGSDSAVSFSFWEDKDEEVAFACDVPVHPFMRVFDLRLHTHFKVHVANLQPHVWDDQLRDKLVLPQDTREIIDLLLVDDRHEFSDVLANKSGGVTIICQGPPGTGKTLTAEVYAETSHRSLYSVQCSQLGIKPADLEAELDKVFARAERWNAILLLDECDVYVRRRDSDLTQNAIVGVFLRVIEYYGGILFMATNRSDLIDDAILSRCTARISYDVPSVEAQVGIWKILLAANGITNVPVAAIVAAHDDLSGRDIKELLRLVLSSGKPVTPETIAAFKKFKPTASDYKTIDCRSLPTALPPGWLVPGCPPFPEPNSMEISVSE